jgi:hypothetical protein
MKRNSHPFTFERHTTNTPNLSIDSTPEVFVSKCCGGLFTPGHGPDDIVDVEVHERHDAVREGECPACGGERPFLAEVDL